MNVNDPQGHRWQVDRPLDEVEEREDHIPTRPFIKCSKQHLDITLTVEGQKVNFLIDTGATKSVIMQKGLPHVKLSDLKPASDQRCATDMGENGDKAEGPIDSKQEPGDNENSV